LPAGIGGFAPNARDAFARGVAQGFVQPAAPPVPPARALRVPANLVAPFGVRYTVLRRSAAGDLTEADPRQQLEPDDQVVVRVESGQSGYLTVQERDAENQWRSLANEFLQAGVPALIPPAGAMPPKPGGTRELLVHFSRFPQIAAKNAPAAEIQRASTKTKEEVTVQATMPTISVVATSAEPQAQEVSVPITLRYK
jgi:hypothetical protein